MPALFGNSGMPAARPPLCARPAESTAREANKMIIRYCCQICCVLGIAAALAAAGCSQGPPTANPHPALDPGGMGSPQKRLEELKANTMMDPRLKARKMRIIEDEINGTHTAAPGRH